MPRSLYLWRRYLQYSLYRRLGGPQNWSGKHGEEKICPYWDLNPDPSVVQPVVSHCTDCAIQAPVINSQITNNCKPPSALRYLLVLTKGFCMNVTVKHTRNVYTTNLQLLIVISCYILGNPFQLE
jgi:hypothetical protein